MAQAQNTSQNAVSGLQPLSYLNQNQAANVLSVRQKRAPTPNDRRFKFGTLWFDSAANTVYALVSVTNNSAFWSLLGTGTGDLETLTGDTGGAISPSAGNINVLGGSNIEVTGSASTLTVGTTPAISADSFETLNPPQGINVTTNVVSAVGSNADIDVTLTPKGAGDVSVTTGSVAIESVGEGLEIKEGANARMGTVTFPNSPTVLVPNTSVTATTRIFFTRQTRPAGTGGLSVGIIVPGVSFSLTSNAAIESATVTWMLVEPA